MHTISNHADRARRNSYAVSQSLSSWPLQIDFVFLTKCRADMKQKCFSTYFKYERKKGYNENKTENSL